MRPKPLVLLVEDDDAIAHSTQRRLSGEWAVLRAANDVEACVALREFGGELKCLVTDLHLAGSSLSGVDLLQLVRQPVPDPRTPSWARLPGTLRNLPVIVTTGSDPLLHLALRAGANRVLLKPFPFDQLRGALRQLVPGAAAAPALEGGVPFTVP